MSIFDFVTKAGSKLGGKIFDIVSDDVDMTEVREISPEERANAVAKSIHENIDESGVLVQNLKVSVENDRATLNGRVATQACAEKITLVAGNQYGIGSVDCQLEVTKPEPEAKFYTVKSGDTLGKIAKNFYGDASKYPVIFEANQPMLADPDKIYVGQNLRIPAA
ncbi:MAG: peptidoglycan-binding protein LysM [Pseudomonadales bacterium]|nr:peptidoglycan-binding protein LysM [Pseudomonadales bacterium]